MVCIATSYVDPSGVALFEANGEATPRWNALERLLSEYEADLDRTAQLSAAVARLQLLEPFSVQRVGGAGAVELRLGGMYRVSEGRLRDLNPASHKVLAAKGFTGLVHAHLHSLQNFSRLAARLSRAAPRRTTDARG